MTDDAPRADADLIDEIHDALDALRREGAMWFTVEDLQRRVPSLAPLSPRRIDRMLSDMRRGGEGIFQDAPGEDGTHSWSFGVRRPRTACRK
jgi:hypothetical protein